MANKYASQSAFNWSDQWCDADDGVQDVTPPGATDTAFLTALSGDCTLTANTGTITALRMDNYTGTLVFAAWAMDVDGYAKLGGTVTASSGAQMNVSGDVVKNVGLTLDDNLLIIADGSGLQTIQCNSVTGGQLQINNSGTALAFDDQFWTTWNLASGGLYDDTGETVTVAGDITSRGQMDGSGKFVMAASGDLNVNVTGIMTELEVQEGVVATCTTAPTNTYLAKLSGTGQIKGSAPGKVLRMWVTTSPWWSFTGEFGENLNLGVFVDAGSVGPGADISIGANNPNARFFSYGLDYSITMDGNLNLGTGDLAIEHFNTAGKTTTVDMAAYNLICADIKLGSNSVDAYHGAIDFGTGTHQIASLAVQGTNKACAVDFGSAYITLTGTLAGASIAETNTGGVVVGGTVNDVDVSGSSPLLHLYPATAGTGNTDVTEISPPTGKDLRPQLGTRVDRTFR